MHACDDKKRYKNIYSVGYKYDTDRYLATPTTQRSKKEIDLNIQT